MAILKKKKKNVQEIAIQKLHQIEEDLEKAVEEQKETEENKINELKNIVENKKNEATGIKNKSIRKGSKVIANGRCFGASSLQCPLKTVRNYETKILDIDKEHNSVLIDEGWINKDFVK